MSLLYNQMVITDENEFPEGVKLFMDHYGASEAYLVTLMEYDRATWLVKPNSRGIFTNEPAAEDWVRRQRWTVCGIETTVYRRNVHGRP
jgi:hypothetical protein